MERKLAVILVADIVGYSAQMERDEAGTYARVMTRRREIFEPAIARHQGRIFKLTGDGLLAEFGSAVQAVECAVALQAGLAERNQALPDAEPILARIGINLGEVIVDGDDRYGEGVNIAARLEQLAEPGGICVSEKVAREVEKKLAFGFEAMGAQKLKNIAEPVHAFRVSNQATVWRLPGVRRSRWLVLGGAILALVIAVIAVLGVIRQTQTQATPAHEGPLSIAVLNFANHTGDPERAYIGLALPDNISVILGSSPLVQYSFYVAKGTAQPGGVRAIASDFRVDLVLDGSIGLASPGISFTGRLYNGLTGDVATSFSIDVPDGDLVRLQYLIAASVVDAVAALTNAPQTAVLDPDWAKSSAEPDEYAFYLRGLAARYSAANSSEDDARKINEAGLARYPQSVILRIQTADIHRDRSASGPEKTRWEEAQTALSLLSGLPEASTLPLFERWELLFVRARVIPHASGDFEASMRDAEEAVRLVPFFQGNIYLSWVAANAGYGDRAVEWALAGLNPDSLPTDFRRSTIAWGLLVAGRPEEALAEYGQIWGPCDLCQVVALVRTGRMDKARSLVSEIRKNDPEITIASERTFPTGHQPQMAEPFLSAYLDDLRKAGLPETAPPD